VRSLWGGGVMSNISDNRAALRSTCSREVFRAAVLTATTSAESGLRTSVEHAPARGAVAGMERKLRAAEMEVVVEVIDAVGAEQAVHVVALRQQPLGQIGAVPAGDARN
jgi:hypothetical protein